MKYINIKDTTKYTYCQTPRKILYDEPYKSSLSPLSQLAYIFILDRLNLSKLNNLCDENGNIYIYLTRKEMQDNLKVSNKTTINAFKELVSNGLIYEVSTGKGKAYKIYVVDIFEDSSVNSTPEPVEKLHISDVKNTDEVVENLHTNNISINKYSNNIFSINNEKQILEKIKSNCNLQQYKDVTLKNNESLYKLLESAIEIMYYSNPLKIANANIPNEMIRSRMLDLDENKINQAVDIYTKNYDDITNHQSYLVSVIYNSLVGFTFNLDRPNYYNRDKSSNRYHGDRECDFSDSKWYANLREDKERNFVDTG